MDSYATDSYSMDIAAEPVILEFSLGNILPKEVRVEVFLPCLMFLL